MKPLNAEPLAEDRADEIFRRFFRPPPPGKQVWVPASPGRLGILCCGGEPEVVVSLPNELKETKKAA